MSFEDFLMTTWEWGPEKKETTNPAHVCPNYYDLLSNGTHSHIHLSRMLLQTYLSHPLTKARQAARTFYVCLSTPFIFNQTYAMQLFPRMNKYIPFPHQLPPDWAISRAFILVMFKTSKLSRLKKKTSSYFDPRTTDHGHTKVSLIFEFQIQNPIPNEYLGCWSFCSNNGWIMENMDKGLTVPKWYW